MAFFICFASCLILGNADNQQGRGVKCIINYWEGATSLLELILMLLLPLWVMWRVKYFSRDRGAAPQHSFAYQINSSAWWRCQPRQLCYMYLWCTCICKGATKVYWISLTYSRVWGWGSLYMECIEEMFQMVSITFRVWHFWFEASQVNMVIKTNLFTENIIRNFTHKRFHINTNTVPDHSYLFHVFKLHYTDKETHLNSAHFHLQ